MLLGLVECRLNERPRWLVRRPELREDCRESVLAGTYFRCSAFSRPVRH